MLFSLLNRLALPDTVLNIDVFQDLLHAEEEMVRISITTTVTNCSFCDRSRCTSVLQHQKYSCYCYFGVFSVKAMFSTASLHFR